VTPGSRPIRTPGTARTPRGGPATRPIPARRAAPTTPHAIRALRERVAARTPGHVRRRSGRIQRETPRDILRDLSRVLARDTGPVEPSPQEPPRRARTSALDLPDVDDGPDPAVPRLSMPLGDMYDDEDDSFHGVPPRQSLLPNLPDDVDNGTIQSLEFGRRAISEDPRMMFATRVSERFGELNELVMDDEEYEIDGTFINRRQTVNPDDLLQGTDDEDLDNTTTEIRALTGRRNGRPSDVDLGVFGNEDDENDEPTFRFTIPPRIQATIREEEEETQDAVGEHTMDHLEGDEVQAGAELDREGEIPPMVTGDDDPTAFEITGWESEPDIGGDADVQAYREEVSAMDRSLQTENNSPERPATQKRTGLQRKVMNISRFGHEYPSLPAATVKTLATGFAKSQGSKGKISKDTLAVLVQTSDFFFEQMGEDLAAYAQHGGRRMIEESDVIALMKRYVTVPVSYVHRYKFIQADHVYQNTPDYK
jgi:histone H3/H4